TMRRLGNAMFMSLRGAVRKCRRLWGLAFRPATLLVLLSLPVHLAVAESLCRQQPLLLTQAAGTTPNPSTTLEPGKTVEHDLAGGESHTYLALLTEGQYVKVVVDQRGVDVSLKSFDPFDHPIAVADLENRPEG